MPSASHFTTAPSIMKSILPFFVTFLLVVHGNAADDIHCRYEGTINSKYPIEMSIATINGKAYGSYFYKKNPQGKLFLAGKITKDSLYLPEYDKDVSGIFQGLVSSKTHKITGQWSNKRNTKTMPFNLECRDSSFVLPPPIFNGWYADQMKQDPDQPTMLSCKYRFKFFEDSKGLNLKVMRIGTYSHEGEDYEQTFEKLNVTGRAIEIQHKDDFEDVFAPISGGTRITIEALDSNYLLVGSAIFIRTQSSDTLMPVH